MVFALADDEEVVRAEAALARHCRHACLGPAAVLPRVAGGHHRVHRKRRGVLDNGANARLLWFASIQALP